MATLRQKIAQMLIIGFSGTTIDETPIKEWLRPDGLGGVLLFDYDLLNKRQGKNLVNPVQIKNLIKQINNCETPISLPLLIALDYEGGAVDRLRFIEGCKATLMPKELAALSLEQMQTEVEQMAKTLKSLHFNLNFAPLLDLTLNETQGIIGKLGRSFSEDPTKTAKLAKLFVESFAKQKIHCCYKHFPGHGSAIGDTHEGFVDVTETFELKELEPYKLLLKEESKVMVMTAHVINRKLDPSGLPATLSKTMLTHLLRQEFGFNGVIISDDLQMHAISKHYSIDEALSLTINAGSDMMIFANQIDEITPIEVIDKIEKLVLTGKIAENRIEESYQRIAALKNAYSI